MPAGKRNPVMDNLTKNHRSLHCNSKLVGFFAYFVLLGGKRVVFIIIFNF